MLRKRFNYAKEFAEAKLEDIVSSDKMSKAHRFSADYFANCLLINDGEMKFSVVELPWQAQLTSFRDAAVADVNNDKLPDLLLAGNFYENNIDMGRYDADYGSMLINKGSGKFAYERLSVVVKGQARKIRRITIGGKEAYIIARNNDSAMVVQFENKTGQ